MTDCFECDCLREQVRKLEQQLSSTADQQYEWATIINRLATIAVAEEVSTDDRDYVQAAIDMIIPCII